MLIRCHVYGKKNCEGPEGWEDNDELPWFDPKGKYGGEISGAISKGYSAKEVISFFQKIERFADYCFNKSHAACYSLIGIMSAWLKLHYPTQFWAAVLTVMMDDKDKRARYLELCKQEGIGIDVPDINVSGAGFTPLENKILFGLGAVKKLGKAGLMAILSERERTGPFLSIANACERLQKKDFKKDTAMNLIKAGAFTFEGQNRYALLNKFLDIRNEKRQPDTMKMTGMKLLV